MKIEAGKFYETANGSTVVVGHFMILNGVKNFFIATVVAGGHDFKKRNGNNVGESFLINENGDYAVPTDPNTGIDEINGYLLEKMTIVRKVKIAPEFEAKSNNPGDTWRE